jgi:hypothetical protein
MKSRGAVERGGADEPGEECAEAEEDLRRLGKQHHHTGRISEIDANAAV